MTRIELKNGACFGNYATCVMLTVSQSNPLSDDELITCASTRFEESFGNVPWWVGVCRKPATDENITIVFQKAPKNYRRISDPKHIFYNRTEPIDRHHIELAMSSAKSRCIVPIKRASVHVPDAKKITVDSATTVSEDRADVNVVAVADEKVHVQQDTSQMQDTFDSQQETYEQDVVVDSAESVLLIEVPNVEPSYVDPVEKPKGNKGKMDFSDRSLASFAALLSEL